MSFAPIAYIIPQYENYPNWWLKAYEQGTTTPKTMAIDALGNSQVAKYELNIDGFPATAGLALVIPFIDGAYDLFLFPTEAEADANDTNNALRLADDITAPALAGSGSTSINELTTASMTANTNKQYEVGDVVQTGEFSTGNGGGGVYDAVLTSGVTPNTYNIIIGVADPLISFVLRINGVVSIDQLGTSSDDTVAIQTAIDISDNIQLGTSHFISKRIDIPFGKKLITAGKTTITTDLNFDVSGGSEAIYVGTDTITQIADINANVLTDDITIAFSGPHGLVVGNVFCIYDPTDFSWSSSRAEYRAGEFCEVSEVISTTEVRLTNGLHADYVAATVDVYLMSMGTFSVEGHLEIIVKKPTGNSFMNALVMQQVAHSTVSNIVCRAEGGASSAVLIKRCFNLSLPNITAIQEKASGVTTDYGISIGNSQHIRTSGYYSSSRHGLSHGGGGGATDVSCRDCHHTGTVKTSYSQNVEALDVHGNGENISFIGTVYGGITAGGSNFKFLGTCYSHAGGMCVLSSEVRTFDHDYSGSTFITSLDPQALNSRGVIDFGGNSTFESDNMKGGTLNLSGITVKAPNAKRAVIIRTRNATSGSEDKVINLRGANLVTSATSIPIFISDDSGSNNFSKVLMKDVINTASAGATITQTDFIELHAESGGSQFTTTVAISSVDVVVVFDQPYPNTSAKQPAISLVTDRGFLGATAIGLSVVPSSLTSSGFTVRVNTVDGSNFAVAATYNFWWAAS